MGVNMTQEDYISVLKNEIEILKKNYYDETQEGTGHFNTAISVLKQRIKDIEVMKVV
jgi:hypothetical protein